MTGVESPVSSRVVESPVLEGISWQTYTAVLREMESAGQRLRVTYGRGRMVVMSPLPIHEKWKQLIGRMIEVLAEERDLPISAYGSTTWRREDLFRGLESDQCYYLQSVPAIRGKIEIDLTADPPPDLAVEIDNTTNPLDRPGIYASLRIPEVWCYNGQRLRVLHLAGKSYIEKPVSAAFPDFRPAELERFLAMHPACVDSEIVRAFRASIRGA